MHPRVRLDLALLGELDHMEVCIGAYRMTGISAPLQVSRSACRVVAEPHQAECWRSPSNGGIDL
jgi:hypothetical protein